MGDEGEEWLAGYAPVFKSEKVIEVNGKKMLQKHWAQANREAELHFRCNNMPLDIGKIQDYAFEQLVKGGHIID